MRKISGLLVGLAALSLCGCNESKTIEQKEERDPLIKTAHAFMEQGQWKEAIEPLKEAMENEPRMARPHLDLATIYQQHYLNYFHAIYHYDRYLELRPSSEKKEFIEQQKERISKALANTVINNSAEVKQLVAELKRLQRENAQLKQKLAATGSQPSSVKSTAGSTTPQVTAPPQKRRPAQAETTKQPKPAHQIYHVVAGDTLSKIASRFYGNSGRWDDIYQANKDRMRSPGDLRVGQTLVIPNPTH